MTPDRDTRLLEFIDELAMSLPNGFVWPAWLRAEYDWAIKLLEPKSAPPKLRKHASHN